MRSDEEPVNFEEVARLQNLDEQIDQRLHGNTQARPGDQDALDPEFLRDLHEFHQSHGQAFQHGLNRVWDRLEQHGAAAPQQGQQRDVLITPTGLPQERQLPMQPEFRPARSWLSRASVLIAAVLLVVLVSALTLGLILVRANGNGSNTGSGNQATATAPASATSTPASAAFTVTSVDLAVTPTSIAGQTCGSTVTFTYTATFHIPAGTAGGPIQFQYTVNNGRGSTSANVNVGPGETTHTYTFTSSGMLSLDNTYPGIAEVIVTSPNAVNSPQVQPSGTCGGAAFKVTSVTMSVSPTSIAGLACGAQTTVTYTAIFHFAANGTGGVLRFEYTVNNGRGTTPVSLSIAPGQTSITYHFTWSGKLPADHTAPGEGGVIVDYPNQLNSIDGGPNWLV